MKHHFSPTLLLACASLLPPPPVRAQLFTSPDPAPATALSDDYAQGTKALDQQRWQDAVTAFDRVVATHGKRADAALYWKAYALNKLHRSSLVSATCSQLHGSYTRSTWNRDCSTLLAAMADPGIYAGGAGADRKGSGRPAGHVDDNGIYRGGSPHADEDADATRELQHQLELDRGRSNDPGDTAGSDADLKMLALNSVLQRDPAQALPSIRGILTGGSSAALKQRAITALAMSESPGAQSLLRDVATGKVAPAEQRQAITMLGVFQGKRADETLVDIYRTSNDHGVKNAALNGLFIASDAPRLVELARAEKDLSLKHDIVTKLALMHDKAATDYMLELLK